MEQSAATTCQYLQFNILVAQEVTVILIANASACGGAPAVAHAHIAVYLSKHCNQALKQCPRNEKHYQLVHALFED